MDIKTIDQRIRDQAKDRLRADLNRATGEFCKAINIIGTTDKVTIQTIDKQEVEVYNRNVIEAFREHAFKKISPSVEQKAIADFMKKVDQLQTQIDDLYSEVDR